MPRPPPDDVPPFFLELKRQLLEEMQNAKRELLQQQSGLIQSQEISLQKMMVRLLSQQMSGTSMTSMTPEQVPELAELQSDSQNVPSELAAVAECGENEQQGDASKATAEEPKAPIDRGATWISENTSSAKAKTNVAALHHSEGFFCTLVDSHAFQGASFLMIILNAIYLGVEADWNTAKNISDYPPEYQFCEHGFCSFFTLELLCRFFTFKSKRDIFKDNWFVFDFVMVVLMVADTWVLTIIMAFNPGASGGDTGVVGGVGRLLRLLRLIRISRLMQLIPELVTMAKGMIAAIRAVHAALLILFILIYVFAIIMNSLVGDEPSVAEYFPSVRSSMVTLLVNAVFLDDFSALVATLIDLGSVLPLLLLAVFVLLSALTVMNMLIGVLCQVVLDVSAEEEENNVKAQMAKSLLVMLEDLDDDKSGQLSKAEVQDVMCEPEAVAIMQDIQVDTCHLLDLTEMLYATEGSTLPISTFMNILLQLRGKRPVTMNDLAKSDNFFMWALEKQLTQHRELMTAAVLNAFRLTLSQHSAVLEEHKDSVKGFHETLKEVQVTFQTQHRQTAQAAGVY